MSRATPYQFGSTALTLPWEDDRPPLTVEPARAPLPVLPPPAPQPARPADPRPAETIICQCMQVPLGQLQECVRRGCTTEEALARETGVTTVCGGCTHDVAEIVGSTGGYLAQIVEVQELAPAVRSFRFAPLEAHPAAEAPALAGQHVVISAEVDGEWVSRPYTLTSPPTENRYQEITVQREPNGRASGWLFQGDPNSLPPIRVTPPRGHFHVDLARPEPVVFFAAGIGITPAICMARAAAAAGAGCKIQIDYSARATRDHAFRDELYRIALETGRVFVRFRETGRRERLGPAQVMEYTRLYPDARYCICGPTDYQDSVKKHLAAAGVPLDRIQLEVFTPVRRAPTDASVAPRRLRDSLIRWAGFAGLLIYLVQGVFGLHWEWLRSLQDVESYRLWSGGVLATFLLVQWLLPGLRISGRFKGAAKVYPWHRWLGALAPLLFYAHAVWLGYGYLVLLAMVFLSNVLVGLWDKTIVADLRARDRYARVWLTVHVTLACLTMGLTLFHIYVVFGYR